MLARVQWNSLAGGISLWLCSTRILCPSTHPHGSYFFCLTKFPDFSSIFSIFLVFFQCFVFLTENLIHFRK